MIGFVLFADKTFCLWYLDIETDYVLKLKILIASSQVQAEASRKS
jgi:hypothetical protein